MLLVGCGATCNSLHAQNSRCIITPWFEREKPAVYALFTPAGVRYKVPINSIESVIYLNFMRFAHLPRQKEKTFTQSGCLCNRKIKSILMHKRENHASKWKIKIYSACAFYAARKKFSTRLAKRGDKKKKVLILKIVV